MLGDREGFSRGGRIDAAGVANVLAIRAEFGQPRKVLGDASRYVDESWLKAALSGR
jgi:hypothetical protein